jgi:hypothetical protein
MKQPKLELVGGWATVPRPSASASVPSDYPARLTDGELAAHCFDTICDVGPGAEYAQLKAEADRRGLTMEKLCGHAPSGR